MKIYVIQNNIACSNNFVGFVAMRNRDQSYLIGKLIHNLNIYYHLLYVNVTSFPPPYQIRRTLQRAN